MHGNGVGPLRVWMKNLNLPGLAMTRSFGDKFGIQAGVTALPEILEFKIMEDDKFLIIASDGVWEHLSSQEVVILV
jgi:serine/threonine protein phosphatase PrpC